MDYFGMEAEMAVGRGWGWKESGSSGVCEYRWNMLLVFGCVYVRWKVFWVKDVYILLPTYTLH